MDFGLYLRVLWRFRVLVLAGVLLSVALAFLSHVRVEFNDGRPEFAARTVETWQSTALLQVTERGFPAGVSVFPSVPAAKPGEPPPEPVYSEPSRFQDLAILYSKYAESDEVREKVYREGGGGTYAAQPAKTDDGQFYLPFIRITATSSSAEGARDLAARATDALRSYIEARQEANEIPADRRVELPIANRAESATLVSGSLPVKPVLILIVGLAGTLGLAFVLENLRPRVRPAPAATASLQRSAETRRTA